MRFPKRLYGTESVCTHGNNLYQLLRPVEVATAFTVSIFANYCAVFTDRTAVSLRFDCDAPN